MELNIEDLLTKTKKNLKKNILYLFLLFFGGSLSIFLFIFMAPSIDSQDASVFFAFPNTNEKIIKLTQAINAYTEESYGYVLCLFCLFYIFLQSFAIPGPLILSIISGAIFGR